jgi:hypothetical protein
MIMIGMNDLSILNSSLSIISRLNLTKIRKRERNRCLFLCALLAVSLRKGYVILDHS